MTALGFIETKGFIAAIEGADAMLKAARVCLVEKNFVGGGLVTITVSGDVSAVRASVDAAVVAIKRINGATLVSEHVIARPDTELTKIIAMQKAQTVGIKEVKASADVQDSVQANVTVDLAIDVSPKVEPTIVPNVEPDIEPEITPVVVATGQDTESTQNQEPELSETPEPIIYDLSQLKKMSVHKLRQIARNLHGLSMTKGGIKAAQKNDLIKAIINVYSQKEE